MPSHPPARRLTPWVALAALVLLAGGAATASALAASTGNPSPSALSASPGSSSGGATGSSSGASQGSGTSSSSSSTTLSAGTGSSGTGVAPPGSVIPPGPTTTSTVIQAPPGTLVLTQTSAGQSYSIAPGQLVQVVLPGTGQQYHGYTTPQSDSAAVQPDEKACGAPSGDFCTEYVGTSTGAARLTSTLDPACRQAVPPCEVASMVWWVDLTVQ